MLEVKNISKTFHFQKHFGEKFIDLQILKNINFKIEEGEKISILGSSGSGKTTLAKIIALLLKPSCGEILLNKKDLLKINKTQIRKHIGFIMQNQKKSLNPSLKISTQIKLAKHYLKITNPNIENLANILNLKQNVFDKFSYELSGGEATRVGILMALLSNPQILICDEITNGLDENIKEKIIKLLKSLDKSLIFITHDLESAKEISDKILLLEDGEQKIFANLKECWDDTLLKKYKDALNFY